MKPQKPTTTTGKIVRLLIVVFGFYVLYAFYNPGNGLIRYWKLQRIRNEERREFIHLQQEKRKLEEAIQRLESDTLYMEELAREMGMVKEGETGYWIMDKPVMEQGQNEKTKTHSIYSESREE